MDDNKPLQINKKTVLSGITRNTIANKTKFFAKYLGVRVLVFNCCNELKLSTVSVESLSMVEETDYLFLKNSWNNGLNIDEQRSYGFATGYMELSVADLVRYGWIKIES